MPGKHIPDHLQVWIDARKKFHLSHAQVQMARELGFNPKKFGKIANHKQEPWKIPLPEFIEHLYRKQYGRERPAVVMSIEGKVEMELRKKHVPRQEMGMAKKRVSSLASSNPSPI